MTDGTNPDLTAARRRFELRGQIATRASLLRIGCLNLLVAPVWLTLLGYPEDTVPLAVRLMTIVLALAGLTCLAAAAISHKDIQFAAFTGAGLAAYFIAPAVLEAPPMSTAFLIAKGLGYLCWLLAWRRHRRLEQHAMSELVSLTLDRKEISDVH
jgi:Flp pilus assembly protein TadB